jgi:uncharacterized protein
MIELEVSETIRAHLLHMEATESVRILYACESGSRAWGFPSADSDYDVRFLYLRPLDWYLTIEPGRDVLEFPIREGLDINGWDLQKALLLFRKSNPPLLEWLGSPIIYWERDSVTAQMRALADDCYSPVACAYHYLHMARGNFRDYLQGDEVWVKKYFYVLRPLLAILWIEQGRGIVPTEFGVLVDALVHDPLLKQAIETLVEEKRRGAELKRGPRIPVISQFIEYELGQREAITIAPGHKPSTTEKLNQLFLNALKEVW